MNYVHQAEWIFIFQIEFFQNILIGQEDCLYLNVYTKALPTNKDFKALPVMIWIHGGGFISGDGGKGFYGPEFFMDEDIVWHYIIVQ